MRKGIHETVSAERLTMYEVGDRVRIVGNDYVDYSDAQDYMGIETEITMVMPNKCLNANEQDSICIYELDDVPYMWAANELVLVERKEVVSIEENDILNIFS